MGGEKRSMVGQMHWAKEDRFREKERSMVGEMIRNERAALTMMNYQDSI